MKIESKTEAVESWLTHGHLGKADSTRTRSPDQCGSEPFAVHEDVSGSREREAPMAAGENIGILELGDDNGEQAGSAKESQRDPMPGTGAVGLFGDTPASPMFQRQLDTCDGTFRVRQL